MGKQEDWKERYDSLAQSVKKLEMEKEMLMKTIITFESEKRQWETEKIKQQEIIQQQLGNSDDVVGQLQDEIRSIKKQLCEGCFKKVR